MPWPAARAFDVIGWAPEGGVVFQYTVQRGRSERLGSLTRFTAETTADLDSDGDVSFFAYIRPRRAGAGWTGALPGTTCVGTGVWGREAAPVAEPPGPATRPRGAASSSGPS